MYSVLGSSITSTGSVLSEQKVTLVFFIGGVTYAEISALRFLAQLEDGKLNNFIFINKCISFYFNYYLVKFIWFSRPF